MLLILTSNHQFLFNFRFQNGSSAAGYINRYFGNSFGVLSTGWISHETTGCHFLFTDIIILKWCKNYKLAKYSMLIQGLYSIMATSYGVAKHIMYYFEEK